MDDKLCQPESAWYNQESTFLLRVICGTEQAALHKKSLGIGNYVTQRHHLPDYKVYSQTEYQKRLEEKMADIGQSAHDYFRLLLETKDGYWSRTVRGILGLCEIYGQSAVNLTLKRAMYYKAVDLITIKNILEKKLYLLEEEPRLPKTQDTKLEQITMFRDLSYYTNNGGNT